MRSWPQTAAPPLLPVFPLHGSRGRSLALVLGDPGTEVDGRDDSFPAGPGIHGTPWLTSSGGWKRRGCFTGADDRAKQTHPRQLPRAPYYEPLFAASTHVVSAPPQVIREGNSRHWSTLSGLFIFGSWGGAVRWRGRAPAPHDVDVLIIGAPDRPMRCTRARPARAQEAAGPARSNTTVSKAEQWYGAQDGFAPGSCARRRLVENPARGFPG